MYLTQSLQRPSRSIKLSTALMVHTSGWSVILERRCKAMGAQIPPK